MPSQVKAKLLEKEELIKGIFRYKVETKEIAQVAKPGNFIEIRVADTIEPFLRRPISLYKINPEEGTIEFIFQVKGKGTEILSKREIGEEIDILGPLGYGTFDGKDYKKVAIIGGGIGIFPLYELARRLKENAEVNTYLGFRSKDFVTLEKEFGEVSDQLVITTDDGSYAEKGFAIEFLKKDIEAGKIDAIYACGPLPMLKAVQQLSKEKNIPCQISLEERMGCGIGACLGCAVKIVSGEEPYYAHVCKRGPVFDAKEVEI